MGLKKRFWEGLCCSFLSSPLLCIKASGGLLRFIFRDVSNSFADLTSSSSKKIVTFLKGHHITYSGAQNDPYDQLFFTAVLGDVLTLDKNNS